MVRQLAEVAEQHAHAWVLNTTPTVDDLAVDIPEMVTVYTQSAALLAADWYNSQDPGSSYFAFPSYELPDDRVQNTARWVLQGPQEPHNRMRVAAHKLVFDAARQTVLLNSQTEGVAVVRHEGAAACTRCAVRATNAARARNSRSDDIDTEFHPSCEGMLVPVRTGIFEPPAHAREWRARMDLARHAGNTEPDDIAKWMKRN